MNKTLREEPVRTLLAEESPEMAVFVGPLEVWKYKSCRAEFGVGDNWATLYSIESKEPSKGHATELLIAAQKHYKGKGLFFGGSVALKNRMKSIYQRLGIYEYC